MVSVYQIKQQIRELFIRHDIESADFEINCLLEHITGKDRQWLLLNRGFILTPHQEKALAELINRRIKGEPLQYLLGKWEFFGLEFEVGNGVLIPREDTEIICEFAISNIRNNQSQVIDLCAGTGCIGITVQQNCPASTVSCVELSEKALPYLDSNIRRHGSKVNLIQGDVLNPDTILKAGKQNMILSNPPYLTERDMNELQLELTYEPSMAFYGQNDGLYFYREISRLWRNSLIKGGYIVFEIGINQEKDVAEILLQNSFHSIGTRQDYSGIPRIVYGVK